MVVWQSLLKSFYSRASFCTRSSHSNSMAIRLTSFDSPHAVGWGIHLVPFDGVQMMIVIMLYGFGETWLLGSP